MNWLLLRGLGRVQEHWLDFIPALEKKNHNTLCLDLPGFGTHADESAPLTIKGNTEFLRDQFQSHKNGRGRWGLVGISLGGMIAMDWAARYPQDFDKICVINTSSKDVAPLTQRMTPFAMYCITRAQLARTIETREQHILNMISNLKKNDKKTLKRMLKISKSHPPPLAAISKQLVAASQFVSPNKIKIPMQILASIKDAMVDVRCSKALADKFKAQIKFHPTAGHELTLDDPEWVAEQVHLFSQTKN